MILYTRCATHKNLMFGSMGNSFSGLRYLQNVISSSNLTTTFSSVSSNENTGKDFLVSLFNLSPALGMICVNKNVHLVMQHSSLGSMTEGSTDTSEILMPIPKFEQELSIYIFLSPARMVDFKHPK